MPLQGNVNRRESRASLQSRAEAKLDSWPCVADGSGQRVREAICLSESGCIGWRSAAVRRFLRQVLTQTVGYCYPWNILGEFDVIHRIQIVANLCAEASCDL